LLIRSNRLAFAGALALFVFTGYISFSVMLEPTLQSEITSTDTIETIFSTMIQVLVTGTTLVVTISQLVLSQEDGPLGDQRQRMSDAMDVRTYMSELIEDVVSNQPSAFPGRLVAETGRRAEALDQLAADADDQDYRDAVSTVVESIQSEAQAVEEDLFSAEFGTFDLLDAALDFDYSEKIYKLERLEHCWYPQSSRNPGRDPNSWASRVNGARWRNATTSACLAAAISLSVLVFALRSRDMTGLARPLLAASTHPEARKTGLPLFNQQGVIHFLSCWLRIGSIPRLHAALQPST